MLVSYGGGVKRARNGIASLGLVWLIGLAIFISPFVLVNNGSGAGYGVALGVVWTLAVTLFWIKVGLPAAREEARWERLEKARKEGRSLP